METVPLSGRPLSSPLLLVGSALCADDSLVVNLVAGLRSSSLAEEIRRCEVAAESGAV